MSQYQENRLIGQLRDEIAALRVQAQQTDRALEERSRKWQAAREAAEYLRSQLEEIADGEAADSPVAFRMKDIAASAIRNAKGAA